MQSERIKKRELGIYVHIPFCVKKCKYCDFLSSPASEETKDQYIQALLREIDSYREKAQAYQVQTIYFGGGTPSSIAEQQISMVLRKIQDVFQITNMQNLEITIEVNPNSGLQEKLEAYREIGINRVSIGLQSTHEEELQLLGRSHTYEDFMECYFGARKAGFMNISVDVMSALPNQSMEKYEETLRRVAELNPEHISSYSLIVEEGTAFWERYGEGKEWEYELPDEELDRKMYEATKQILREYGYERYEISNYAKAGYESRHNSSYWIRRPYIGFGLGASSFFEGKRFDNCTKMEQYIGNSETWEQRIHNIEEIQKKTAMEEFMYLGLRMTKGIEKQKFYEEFGVTVADVFGNAIEKLKGWKLLEENSERLWLTEYGLDVSNVAFQEFLLEDVE